MGANHRSKSARSGMLAAWSRRGPALSLLQHSRFASIAITQGCAQVRCHASERDTPQPAPERAAQPTEACFCRRSASPRSTRDEKTVRRSGYCGFRSSQAAAPVSATSLRWRAAGTSTRQRTRARAYSPESSRPPARTRGILAPARLSPHFNAIPTRSRVSQDLRGARRQSRGGRVVARAARRRDHRL